MNAFTKIGKVCEDKSVSEIFCIFFEKLVINIIALPAKIFLNKQGRCLCVAITERMCMPDV